MDFKKTAVLALAALLGLALYAAWLWQPARQVGLHTAHFLKAVERRNWDQAGSFVAESYSDRWGHDKEFVLRESREVFRQFLMLTIQSEPAPPALDGTEAKIRVRLKIAGQGSPVAQYAMEKVNTLSAPFVFTWQRSGGAPWRWRLISVDHPDLEIPAGGSF